MDGGIRAWKGLVAGGPPEAGMAYFSGKERAEDLIALAWSLEEGSRRFYNAVSQSLSENRPASDLFNGLVRAEEHHEAALVGLYREVTGDTAISAIPSLLFSDAVPGEIMEGGISVVQALSWTRGREINDILDMSIALESHAYDLYIKMERALPDERAKRIFQILAGEEKVHLERMVVLLEKQHFPSTK